VTPFLAFPAEVRRVIFTTNAIEALNRQLRKAIKTKGSFPTEDAARKLVYLALQNAVPQWTRTRTGRSRCSRSKSTSTTASPTPQTDYHTFTSTGVTVTLPTKPPTQSS
jgi:transposase-like protein